MVEAKRVISGGYAMAGRHPSGACISHTTAREAVYMAHLRPITVWLACAALFALIGDVGFARDNVGVEIVNVGSGLPYEVGEDLQVGTVYYIDRDYTITMMPAELEGIQWIMTGNDDKNSMGADFLVISVDGPVVVWIGHDSRGEEERAGLPPEWLVEGYEKVFDLDDNPEFVLGSTDANMGTFNLWKAEFDKGEIAIGGNAEAPAAGHGSNYVVLVEPGVGLSVDPADKLGSTWGALKRSR
jgi:hypothetical protein